MEKYTYLSILYLSAISIPHPMNEQDKNPIQDARLTRDIVPTEESFASLALSTCAKQHMKDHGKLVGSFAKECKDFFEEIKPILDIEIEYRLAAKDALFSHMKPRYDHFNHSFTSDALDETKQDILTIAYFSIFNTDEPIDIRNANIRDGFCYEQLEKALVAWQNAKRFLNETFLNRNEHIVENPQHEQRYETIKEERKNAFKAFKNRMRGFKLTDIDERLCKHAIEHKLIQQISSNIDKSSDYSKDTFLIYSLTEYCYRKFYQMKLYTEDFREYFILKDKLEQAIAFINDITENKPLRDLQIDSSVFIEIIKNYCRGIHMFLDDLCGNCIEHYQVSSCSKVPVFQKIQAIEEIENFDNIGDVLNKAKEGLISFKEDIKINNIPIDPDLDSEKLLSHSENELSKAILFYDIICEKYGKKLGIPAIDASSSSYS